MNTNIQLQIETRIIWAFAERYNFGVDCPNCGHLYYHPEKVVEVQYEDGFDETKYEGLYNCFGGGCRVEEFWTRMT